MTDVGNHSQAFQLFLVLCQELFQDALKAALRNGEVGFVRGSNLTALQSYDGMRLSAKKERLRLHKSVP